MNVLVYAHREDAIDHTKYHSWLTTVLDSSEAFAYSELVLSGFVRVVTHPRIFRTPTDTDTALEFTRAVRERPNAVSASPGNRHWQIFTGLLRETDAKGNLVADAYLAALAIESGSEWITTDRDYARFPSLRWRHPLRS